METGQTTLVNFEYARGGLVMSILDTYDISTPEQAVEAYYHGRNGWSPIREHEDADVNLEAMVEELIQRERDACQYNGEFARTEDAGNGLTRCMWCHTMTGEHAKGCPSSIVSEPMDVIRFLVKWDHGHRVLRAKVETEHKWMLAALLAAQQFIRNGIEHGYIDMPDSGDSALDVPKMIDAAIRRAQGEGGGA